MKKYTIIFRCGHKICSSKIKSSCSQEIEKGQWDISIEDMIMELSIEKQADFL